MRFVFDATPLIHLAKAGLGWMIEELDGEKYTTPSVHREVVEVGLQTGLHDAPIIDDLIKRGVVKVKAPHEEPLALMMKAHRDLHRGEAEVVVLARSLGAVALIDDPAARRVAEVYGVMKEGSYTIILRALLRGKTTQEQARVSLEKLVSSGWRCDVDLYRRILRSIEEITAK